MTEKDPFTRFQDELTRLVEELDKLNGMLDEAEDEITYCLIEKDIDQTRDKLDLLITRCRQFLH